MRIENIQVGQEIGVVRFSRWGTPVTSWVGTVTKINGHGHIFVQKENGDEARFNKHGESYKNERFGPTLFDATRLRDIIAQEAAKKQRAQLVREIEETVNNGWTGTGNWHPSAERIQSLKELVAELEKSAIGG